MSNVYDLCAMLKKSGYEYRLDQIGFIFCFYIYK